MGQEKAIQTGVALWSKCLTNNSERDVQKVIQKQGTSLDINQSEITIRGIEIPWITPRCWLEWLVRKGFWPRLAGVGRDDYRGAQQVWLEFWTRYRTIYPHFQLFSMENIDLSRTAAFLIHGDEGRTLKRHGIMITSIQSALGYGYDVKRLDGAGGRSHLKVNYVGHSYLHRFVCSAIPKSVYDGDPEIFHDAMEQFALSLKSLLVDGFTDPTSGEHFRIAVIACKGDAPYLAKMGRLYRSYNTLVKRGDERSAPKGICHRCLAGTTGFPAEEINTTSPKWLDTQGLRVPWMVVPAVIKHLVHDDLDPSGYFQSDIWHIVHLGIGRSWVASVINIALEMVPAPNLDEKWLFLTGDYKNFCQKEKRQCHINSITAYLMSYNDKTGCLGNWHKGMLTTNLMLWLQDLLGRLPQDPAQRLSKCRLATVWINELFKCLFRADLFLTEEECGYVVGRGMRWLQTYYFMAQEMFTAGRPWIFPLYGKLHMFHEQMLQILKDCRMHKTSISPILYACQVDEDVVGKTSRLSRRVSIRRVMHRTLDRYKIAAFTAFSKAGLLR